MIAASGLAMWFPEIFTLVFPGWAINVAHIVHSDVALLAGGLHLHLPLLQRALPTGQVPHGSGDVHRSGLEEGAARRTQAAIRPLGRRGQGG